MAAMAAALLMALGFGAVEATPAHASTWNDCVGNAVVCFWSDQYEVGTMLTGYQLSAGVCYNVPGWFNDVMTSAWNNGASPGGYVYYYKDANCTGDYGYLANGTYTDNVGWWMNDEMTSFRRTQF